MPAREINERKERVQQHRNGVQVQAIGMSETVKQASQGTRLRLLRIGGPGTFHRPSPYVDAQHSPGQAQR